jgi:hypothetical protein
LLALVERDEAPRDAAIGKQVPALRLREVDLVGRQLSFRRRELHLGAVPVVHDLAQLDVECMYICLDGACPVLFAL